MKKILIVFFVFVITSCQKETLFSGFEIGNVVTLESENLKFEQPKGVIGSVYCNDSILVTYNCNNECLYSLFDIRDGKFTKDIGMIGHGYNEIPIGCIGDIYGDTLFVSNCLTTIAKYSLSNSKQKMVADSVIKIKRNDAIMSAIAPVESDYFIAIGSYKDKYHYIITDNNENIASYAVELYNANDNRFGTYNKFLSNQGKIIKKKNGNAYVGITFRSGLIDFINVENMKIKQIKSYDKIFPEWKPIQERGICTIGWKKNTINGFIDICGNNKYVFALYSEDLTKELNYYGSKYILVFNWNGDLKACIQMENYVQYIASNNSTLFTIEENTERVLSIKAYKLKDFDN